ncbi:hypothetical protein [Jiangella endophytica]|uniref:hypothetical protein n=1 Tax=Jiangella endophytica TaxID=1623398 RepID=UPI000E3441FD|nr:hypothetical protein [Jiangella endophytica]
MLLELRPSARRRRTVMVTAGLVLAVFVMAATIAGGVAGLLVSLIIGAAGLGIGFFYLSRSRIVLTPSEVAVTGLFGARMQPLGDVTTIVRATVIPPRGPAAPTLFLRGAGDQVLMRINAGHYETHDLDELVRRLGRPAVEHDRPMTAAQLDREHPGIVRWPERRPYSFAFAVGCGTVVLVILIGTAAVVLSA